MFQIRLFLDAYKTVSAQDELVTRLWSTEALHCLPLSAKILHSWASSIEESLEECFAIEHMVARKVSPWPWLMQSWQDQDLLKTPVFRIYAPSGNSRSPMPLLLTTFFADFKWAWNRSLTILCTRTEFWPALTIKLHQRPGMAALSPSSTEHLEFRTSFTSLTPVQPPSSVLAPRKNP